MTSQLKKINYTFGVDYNSVISGKALIPTDTGVTTDNMQTSLPHIMNMLQKPNFFANYAWTASSTSVSYHFPQTLFTLPLVTPSTNLNDAFFAQVFGMFAYCKFGLRFRFKVNGSPFHKGLLGIFWKPGDVGVVPVGSGYEIFEGNQMVYPSVRVSAAGTTEYELDVPSLFYYKYMDMKDVIAGGVFYKKTLGGLVITPWSVLEPAVGVSATVQVSCWVELLNLQLAGPTLIRNPAVTTEPLDARFVHQGLLDAVMDPIAGAAKSVVTGAVDGVKSFARSTVGSIPVIGMSLAGVLDKPPLKVEPLKVCRTSASSWVHGDGTSNASTLTVTPGLLRPPLYEEVGIVGTIADYIRIPALVYSGDITVSSSENAQLIWTPVTPTDPSRSVYAAGGFTPDLAGSSDSISIDNTPISYMSQLYQYWRGSISYSLEVVMPATTTCTLAIVWLPDVSQASLTYDKIASQCSTWVFDCNGPTTTHFDVAFMANQNYKYVARVDEYIDTFNNNSNYYQFMYNGSIGVYLLNHVMSNNAAPPTVTVRLYISAGKDFEFAVPCCSVANIISYNQTDNGTGGTPPGLVSVVPVHQGLTDEVAVSTEQMVTSDEVKRDGDTILDQPIKIQPCLGESHMELSLLKRYQPLYFHSSGGTAFNVVNGIHDWTLMIPVCPTVMSYCVGNDGAQAAVQGPSGWPGRFSTPLNHFGRAFKYWRGSINYRFVLTTNGSPGVIRAYFVPNNSKIMDFTSSTDAIVGARPGMCPQALLVGRNDLNVPTQNYVGQAGRNAMLTSVVGGIYGIELITNIDGGVCDVSVPFFSEAPVKTTCSIVSQTDSLTFGGVVPYPSSTNICSVNDDDNYMNHMTGNIVFSFTTNYNLTANRATRVEVYFAAGDDLVFTYPISPPMTQSLGTRNWAPSLSP
jgi:hypothetical protein